MHQRTIKELEQNHDFNTSNSRGEKRTRYVLILTFITMVAEIIAGTVYGSMALLADGWHMATHVIAFLIAIFAYRFAEQHKNNNAYAFGTGKVSVLGGFASAVALGVVAFMMVLESIERLVSPDEIQYGSAIAVATLGLIVNFASALLLKDDHHHDHGHAHHHHDHNLRAAYVHVLADALTSVLAISALIAAMLFGWNWLDPVVGILGAIIISIWAFGLIRQTSPILLDASIEEAYCQKIKSHLESIDDIRIVDFHIWHVSANHFAAIISIVTAFPKSTDHYRALISDFDKISHLTIEVNSCLDNDCTH